MSGVNRRRAGICLAAAFLFCSMASADNEQKLASSKHVNGILTFGFLPVESPVALFKRFAPLRDYLSTQIEQPVRMETAKNFAEFVRRTEQRQYDIVFTAPHMALHALDGKNYELAATFTKPLQAVVVVRENSPLQDLQALEGKTIATPPLSAIVTLVGMNYLKEQGLKTVRYRSHRTHNAAYSAVLGHEADAAIVANFIAMKAISNNLPLKIVAQSEPFPGIGILVASDLPDSLKQHIRKAMWGMKELPHGKNILKIIAQPGYVGAEKEQFEVLRPYVKAALP